MRYIKRFIITIGLLFPMLTLAAPSEPSFVEGKEYQVIKTAPVDDRKPGEVKVVEFFSYGCPGCYHFESVLDIWLASKPKNVVFERIPVIFHQGWDVYAKAYYVANSMGLLAKIHQPLFNAIHQQNQTLADEQSMADFFAQHGVNRQDFINRYEFMPLIGAQLEKSEKLVQAYGIYEIPTLVIDGKYRTNIAMVNGDQQRFFALLNYLIQRKA